MRLTTDSPATSTNVHGSEVVGESSSAALTTEEVSLRDTIGLRDKAALRAGARGVAGIDRNERDTCERRLIFQKAPQLLESPGMVLSALTVPNGNPPCNAFEVLDGDTERVSSGLVDQGLADSVIYPGREASLLLPSLLQKPLSGLRTFVLQLLSEPGVAIAETVQVSTRVDIPVAVHCDIDDPQVNSEEALRGDGFGTRDFDGLVDIDPSVPLHQDGVNCLQGEQDARSRGDRQPKAIAPELALSVAMPIEWQAPRRKGCQSVAPLRVGVASGDTTYQRERESRRKPHSIPYLVIGAVDQGNATEDALLEGNAGDVITGIGGLLYHVGKGLGIIRSRNLRRNLHGPFSITRLASRE